MHVHEQQTRDDGTGCRLAVAAHCSCNSDKKKRERKRKKNSATSLNGQKNNNHLLVLEGVV